MDPVGVEVVGHPRSVATSLGSLPLWASGAACWSGFLSLLHPPQDGLACLDRDRVVPIFVVEVDSTQRSGVVQLEDTHLVPHCFPDFFYYIPFVPGVDVCCCFCGPVSQVLPLISWESQLVCTVRDKNSESCTAGHLESHHSTDVLVKDRVGTHVLPTTSRGLT